MQYLWMVLFTLGIVAADQVTKLLAVQNIALYSEVEAIPGLFCLTYVQNTGAAFSLFNGMQWLFLAVFILFAGWLVWEFSGKRLPFTMSERWSLLAVFAGGLGNMIDRLRVGYVIDMIKLQFISFPVFNVADCFITCGCIYLLVHLLLINRNFWKEEKK